jgi:hypothetical protein
MRVFAAHKYSNFVLGDAQSYIIGHLAVRELCLQSVKLRGDISEVAVPLKAGVRSCPTLVGKTFPSIAWLTAFETHAFVNILSHTNIHSRSNYRANYNNNYFLCDPQVPLLRVHIPTQRRR